MRSHGGVVRAFSRVRQPSPTMYTEAAQTSKFPENPREAWDSDTARGGKKTLDSKRGECKSRYIKAALENS